MCKMLSKKIYYSFLIILKPKGLLFKHLRIFIRIFLYKVQTWTIDQGKYKKTNTLPSTLSYSKKKTTCDYTTYTTEDVDPVRLF